jgi:ectoine hydroxylase-related dioxygenase (phytanoyl-CoA dioxygenase family)
MSDVKTTYTLDKTQIDFYSKNGYIKLKNILSEDEINYFNQVISEVVLKMKKEEIPLAQRDTYGKAFLQLFNLWKEDDRIKELIFNKRLGQIASELMQVNGVRLYHDQALFKEPQGGITPWHADQHYWPLASDKTITVWIPLQEVPLEMGPLEFSAGSQHLVSGRELSISDESESVIGEKIRLSDFKHIVEPFYIGEVSFHSGWVFHRAGANTTNIMRKVMTIIYMDKDMKLKEPKNSGQLKDWKTWCPGAKLDEVIQTHLNPILYEI